MYPEKPLTRILLADDDRDHTVLFERILRNIYPSVELAIVHDGQHLLQFLSIQAVDFIFLDLKMPCKNGHECLMEIKKNETLRLIPVIVYSNSAFMADIQKSFLHKADFYMVKPFHSDHLKNALTSILSENWKGNTPMKQHYFINNRFVPFTGSI